MTHTEFDIFQVANMLKSRDKEIAMLKGAIRHLEKRNADLEKRNKEKKAVK